MTECRIQPKPLESRARRFDVTEDASQQLLAEWCNGRLRGMLWPARERIIQIDPPEGGEIEVNFGDWIVRDPLGRFGKITDADIRALYDIEGEPAREPETLDAPGL